MAVVLPDAAHVFHHGSVLLVLQHPIRVAVEELEGLEGQVVNFLVGIVILQHLQGQYVLLELFISHKPVVVLVDLLQVEDVTILRADVLESRGEREKDRQGD